MYFGGQQIILNEAQDSLLQLMGCDSATNPHAPKSTSSRIDHSETHWPAPIGAKLENRDNGATPSSGIPDL
jgi:hypothetical protein